MFVWAANIVSRFYNQGCELFFEWHNKRTENLIRERKEISNYGKSHKYNAPSEIYKADISCRDERTAFVSHAYIWKINTMHCTIQQ